MQGIARKIINWVIGILIVYSILAGTATSIIDASDNLTNTSGLPAIIGTVAEFWWVGVLLLLVGVVMNTNIGRTARRYFRRRRR